MIALLTILTSSEDFILVLKGRWIASFPKRQKVEVERTSIILEESGKIATTSFLRPISYPT